MTLNVKGSSPETEDEQLHRKKAEEEIGRARGIIEGLEVEILQKELNRIVCNSILVNLETSLKNLEYFYCMLIHIKYLNYMNTPAAPHFEKSAKEQTQLIKGITDSSLSSIDEIKNELSDPAHYKDEDIRKKIGNLMSELKPFLSTIPSTMRFSLTGIPQIVDLVSMKPMGLDENWAVANCYLSAMEIVVNKRLKEEGITLEKEKDKSFTDKFRDLMKALENKGIKIGELEKGLPPIFWKLRNEVVHDGYNPTQDELNLITTWVQKIIKTLITV